MRKTDLPRGAQAASKAVRKVRDLVLILALGGVLPLVLRTPVVGLLAWIWITLMSPQREVYGFLRDFELNFYVALLTGAAWLISKERKVVPFNMLTMTLIAFGVWGSVSTYAALDRQYSLVIWDRVIKTIALCLAVGALATSKARLQAVLWAVMLSLAYYAVKGGGFVLLTGGQQHVYGPENTMIADNNSLGLALIVFLPLMNYLRVSCRRPVVRWACLAVMACSVLAILGTYSRGALLATAAAGAAYALRSRSGVVVATIAVVLALSLPSVLPSSWVDRMSTIRSYDQDASFEGRVAAWKTSLNIARARPLVGGGFSAVDLDTVAQAYQSDGSLQKGRAAHSIYFEVLGDTGFAGLALYVALLACAWLNTALVLAAARKRPDLDWAGEFARMLQVSLVALMVGGAALSMAYYDGFMILLVITAALLHVVRQPQDQRVAAGAKEPAWKVATGPVSATPAA